MVLQLCYFYLVYNATCTGIGMCPNSGLITSCQHGVRLRAREGKHLVDCESHNPALDWYYIDLDVAKPVIAVVRGWLWEISLPVVQALRS